MFVIEPSDRRLYQHHHRASHRGYVLTFSFFDCTFRAHRGCTVTQLRSFTVLSRSFIQGLQGNELTSCAYSQPAMISHGRRASTTSLTPVSLVLPIHLSFCPSNGILGVPAETWHTERPRWMRIKFNHRENQKGFRCFACRINRRPRRRSNAAT